MNHSRDAHGLISFMDKYIIVVGSWHVEESQKTCEIYDLENDQWKELPQLNEGTCAPGLIVISNRYLYKLGGTTDIAKVEMLDLEKIDFCKKLKNEENGPGGDVNTWKQITSTNKIGRKATINRCLLYPLHPFLDRSQCDKVLVLGCHFGRNEIPFCYDTKNNKYVQIQNSEINIDMYRSNDVVRFNPDSIYIRPFVKIGEPSESAKVYLYKLSDKFESLKWPKQQK